MFLTPSNLGERDRCAEVLYPITGSERDFIHFKLQYHFQHSNARIYYPSWHIMPGRNEAWKALMPQLQLICCQNERLNRTESSVGRMSWKMKSEILVHNPVQDVGTQPIQTVHPKTFNLAHMWWISRCLSTFGLWQCTQYYCHCAMNPQFLCGTRVGMGSYSQGISLLPNNRYPNKSMLASKI